MEEILEYSVDARFAALTVAYTALIRSLVVSGNLDSAAFDRAAASGEARMYQLGFEEEAIAAYADLMRSASTALE